MTEFLRIEGLADAKRALDALSNGMRRKDVRGALREAAKPIVQQAKANAPVRTGLVKKRIGVSSSKIFKPSRGIVGVYIRPRATALARRTKLTSQDPFYYRFQEAGFYAVGRRRLRIRTRSGQDTELRRAVEASRRGARYIEGKAFLGRAFESRRHAALAAFEAAIKRRIDEANRRK